LKPDTKGFLSLFEVDESDKMLGEESSLSVSSETFVDDSECTALSKASPGQCSTGASSDACQNSVVQAGLDKQRQGAPKVRRVRRWTREEHAAFLRGLEVFHCHNSNGIGSHGHVHVGLGRCIAKNIADMIGTKNATQVRSHAQKYFERLAKQANLRAE
jgi:hypothetical protein